MSQVLDIGFTSPPTDHGRYFRERAPAVLYLHELVTLFGQAIGAHGAMGHICCAVDEAGNLHPAFGENPALAGRSAAPAQEAIVIEVTAPDDTPMALLVALDGAIDRQQLSSLRLLANIYATHGITLLEAHESAPADGLSEIEDECLRLILTGRSCLDIGEMLDRSAPAVRVHVRRAMAKLERARF